MEPSSSIHLGRYQRVGAGEDELERGVGVSGWYSDSRLRTASRRPLLLAFGLGVVLTAAVMHVGRDRIKVPERISSQWKGWTTGDELDGVEWDSEQREQSGTAPTRTRVVKTTTTVTVSAMGDPTAQPTASARPNLSPFRIHYNNEGSLNHRDPILPPDCPVPVLYVDREWADVVVWNSDKQDVLKGNDVAVAREERPWQKHLVWGVESGPNRAALQEYFDLVREGKREKTMDGDMTYFLEGVAPAVYAYDYFNFDNEPLPWEDKRQDKIAAVFVSNCSPKNARNLITQELMDLLPGQIDSFGPCKNNANLEASLRKMGMWEQVGNPTRWNLKVTALRKYKFIFALENSNDIDYVTEKFFQPMEQGSVPLYFGTPHFKERFLPTANAAIDIADYVSPAMTALSHSSRGAPGSLDSASRAGLARLAERLKFWASEEGREEYEHMLDWKKGDWRSSAFGKVVQLGREPLAADCRVAGWYRGEEWGKSSWSATPPPEEARRR